MPDPLGPQVSMHIALDSPNIARMDQVSAELQDLSSIAFEVPCTQLLA